MRHVSKALGQLSESLGRATAFILFFGLLAALFGPGLVTAATVAWLLPRWYARLMAFVVGSVFGAVITLVVRYGLIWASSNSNNPHDFSGSVPVIVLGVLAVFSVVYGCSYMPTSEDTASNELPQPSTVLKLLERLWTGIVAGLVGVFIGLGVAILLGVMGFSFLAIWAVPILALLGATLGALVGNKNIFDDKPVSEYTALNDLPQTVAAIPQDLVSESSTGITSRIDVSKTPNEAEGKASETTGRLEAMAEYKRLRE